jgi:hypothetical protein
VKKKHQFVTVTVGEKKHRHLHEPALRAQWRRRALLVHALFPVCLLHLEAGKLLAQGSDRCSGPGHSEHCNCTDSSSHAHVKPTAPALWQAEKKLPLAIPPPPMVD